LLRDVACDDVERRSEPRPRGYRVPGEDTDWDTLALKALRNEEARSSSATDHHNTLIETHGAPTISAMMCLSGHPIR
jgi:hypothetical protein